MYVVCFLFFLCSVLLVYSCVFALCIKIPIAQLFSCLMYVPKVCGVFCCLQIHKR